LEKISAVKRFNIVVAKEDGGVELYPMKQWLRDHPERVPSGLDATSSTSHELRRGLRRLGWSVQETPAEVRLFPPGEAVLESAISQVLGGDADVEEQEGEDAAFGLEFQLRDFIAQNLGVIDVAGRKLRLYVDAMGRDGIEFPTAVGPIDILAVDESGNFYVFELKRARSPDRAMGQVTRYMGWVVDTIGKGKSVTGIIVAKEITTNLRYAVSVMPNVKLFEYEVEFRLKPAHDLNR
jgi:endonuclease